MEKHKIISLILGIVCFIVFVLGIVGVATKDSKNREQVTQWKLSFSALILGVLFMAIFAFIYSMD